MTPFDKSTISSDNHMAPLEQYNFSQLRVRSLFALAALLIATLLLLGTVIWTAVQSENLSAVENSRKIVKNGIQQSLTQLHTAAFDYGYWNDAVAHLEDAFSLAWSDQYLRDSLLQNHSLAGVVVVSAANAILYQSFAATVTQPPDVLSSPSFVALVEGARNGTLPAIAAVHSHQAAYLAAAAPVIPENTPSSPPYRTILVVLQQIDANFMAALASTHSLVQPSVFLENVALSPINNFALLPLYSFDKQHIATLTWRLSENGKGASLSALFPLIATCFVIIAAYASFMLNRMFAMARKLQYSATSLIESEGVFRTLFEDSATPALIIARGMFVDANSAALHILDCHDKSYLIGLSPQRISPATQPDGEVSSTKIENLLATALAGKSLLFEWCHRKFDGTDLHVEVLFSPIRLHGKNVIHVTWRDITLHKQIETQFQNIFSSSPFGILVFACEEDDLILENINPAAQRILHLDTAMIGRRVDDIAPQLLDDDILQRLHASALSGEAWHRDHFRRAAAHGTHDYSLHTFALSYKTVALTLYDTTQQHRLTEELEQRLRYEKALSLISHALLVQRLDDPLSEILHILLDAAHAGRVYIFQNFEDPHDGLCTGQTHEACAPEVTSEINNPLLRHIPYSDPMIARWRTELENGRPILGLTNTFPDCEREILETQGIRSLLVLPLMRGSEWIGFIGFDDVYTSRQWDATSLRLLHTGAELIGAYFDRKHSEGKIHNLAFFDPLTKLPNRRLLVDRLLHALASSERHNVFGGLIFIDLDHFKKINDTYGHQTGDLYLQSISKRLLATVRKSDTVARMGGDEFVILLEDLHRDIASAVTGAELIAENILETIKQPFLLGDNEYAGSASVGVTLFRGFDEGVEELLRRADSAMYRAKGFGRSAIRFYDPAMQAAQDARITMENQLRMAIRHNELRLFYQVQMDSAHRPVGAEALLRWVHPEHGMIPPANFISLAEDTGLIVPIGQWVLEEACQQIKLWEATAWGQHLPLAINVSARQFRQSDFVDQLKSTLAHTGANPCCLKLELTESLVINDVTDTIAKMQQLKQIGIGFSMDDFGTGYSSLSYLRQLPLDQLKIDRSFICDMLVKSGDAIIVQTIIAMAKSLGLEVIAEGVETEEQRKLLSDFGCNLFQGYLFSRPQPLGEFETLLRHSPW